MLIFHEQHDIFESNSAYLFFKHCLATGLQNGENVLLSTISAGRGILKGTATLVITMFYITDLNKP